MSENIQSDAVKSTHCNDCQNSESELWNAEAVPTLDYDRQLFAEKANTTFRELCKALENEQNKLSELESRRKKLQEEMLLLKTEIEEEKESLNANMELLVAEKLTALNSGSNINDEWTAESQTVNEDLHHKKLNVDHEPVTARNLSAKRSQRKAL